MMLQTLPTIHPGLRVLLANNPIPKRPLPRRSAASPPPRPQSWFLCHALGLICATAACAPPSSPAPAQDQPQLLDPQQYASAQAQARAQLQQLYGPQLRLRTDAQHGTVAFLQAPGIALPDDSFATSALTDFVLSYRSLFGVLSADDLKSAGSSTDSRGMTHLRLVQVVDGVPLWGSILSGHLDGRGLLVRVHAHLLGLHLWPSELATPTLRSEEARQQALAGLRRELPTLSITADTPGLFFLPGDRRLLLAYRVVVSGQLADAPVRLALFLSAHTGELLRREDLVAGIDVTVPATGHGRGVLGDAYTLAISRRGKNYSLQDPTRGKLRTTTIRSGEQLPGKTVTSKDPELWDAAGQAVDVHAHLQMLWDYFATRHQRFGWDGKGSGIVAVTHLGVQAQLALFDGERLLFGDGDGEILGPAGAALDVVAHEYGHALGRSGADLAGSGESGALDEGLADLWGCLVEQTMQPVGSNWTLGERLFLANQDPHRNPNEPLLALRDLAAPERTGQARSLAEFVPEPESAGAPMSPRPLLVRDARHHNAGIAARAGYLLAQRLGIEPTAAIVYRAITTYLHRYAGFADALDAMDAAARDLYGEGAQAEAVTASWAAVGVRGLAP